MEAALCEWVSWFVVRMSIPVAVTSVAAGVEQSGDKDPAVFPVSIGDRKRHCATAVLGPGATPGFCT